MITKKYVGGAEWNGKSPRPCVPHRGIYGTNHHTDINKRGALISIVDIETKVIVKKRCDCHELLK